MENILKLLPRILQFPESLCKNLDKILTKSAKNMYDLARSCQELQEKGLICSTEKTQKSVFSTKNLPGKTKNLVKKSKKIQETPRILPRNPGKCKKCQESCQEFQVKTQQKWMKTNKNPRQLRLDQRTYYTTAVRATNQTIMFWISILCVVLYPILQRMIV